MKTAMMRILFIALIGISSSALGAERYEFYNGVRQLGMGGAVVAVVNDETALLSNPAALGKLRDSYITIADPEGEAGHETERVVGLKFTDALDPQKALALLNGSRGNRLHLKGQLFPSLIFPNFGIGLHGKYITDGEVDKAGTAYEYHYLNDWSVVTGFNFRFFNGIMKLGTNFRFTNRSEIHRTDLDPAATNLNFKNLVSEGIGIGSDTGLILSAPVLYLPTLALVWRDVGNTSYSYQKGFLHNTTTRPNSVENTLDVGVSISPIHGKGTRSTWTVEVRDVLTDDKNEDIMRRLHGGFEFNFSDAFFVRGGANQKYWTAGLELAVDNYQLQAASYGEEIGTKDDPKEDRRYVLKFSLRF